MKVNIKKTILFIILFVFFFWLSHYIFENWNIIEQIFIFKEYEDLDYSIKNVISVILSVVLSGAVSNLGVIQAMYFEHKKEKKQCPHLNLNVRSVSIIRRNINNEAYPEIVIGTGEYFLYVAVQLQNVGTELIQNCIINKQKIGKKIINPNETNSVYLRICRKEKDKFMRRYKLFVEFQDNTEESYVYLINLTLDEKRRTAQFKKLYKGKRRL